MQTYTTFTSINMHPKKNYLMYFELNTKQRNNFKLSHDFKDNQCDKNIYIHDQDCID